MRLIVGGRGQGKRAYALQLVGCGEEDVADGEKCSLQDIRRCRIFDGLHRWVRRELEAGRDPWPALVEAMESNPDMVILCDEVGCGIVPIEPFQRQWREETGRICCKLAQQARQVQRVYCGIATTLKEEKR